MKIEITVGMRVEFDSEYGPQRGVVVGVQKDIGNAQGFAVVEVDHALSGMTQCVPLVNLQQESLAA